MFNTYCASNGPPRQDHPAYDNMSVREAMTLWNGSLAGIPVKSVKAKYQLAAMEEPPLRVVGTSLSRGGKHSEVDRR